MSTLIFGDVEITRLVEIDTLDYAPTGDIFPAHDPAVIEANKSWLAPDYINVEAGLFRGCIQSYLVRSAGKTILIDTGVGNHKERPHFAVGTHLDTDYLDRLTAAGVSAAEIDIVIATHVHVDHVGWNTYLAGREWIPTFPNASYVFARADVDYWNPLDPSYAPTPSGRLINQNVYEDSVQPILEAGLATIWDGESYRIDENLLIEATPGHTPGSAVVSLDSGGDRALFIGDLMHSPFQSIDPSVGSCFDEDDKGAADSRHRIVSRAAETKTLMLAPHFSNGEALEVTRDGDGFAFAGWRPYA